jgi:hypothetical protein
VKVLMYRSAASDIHSDFRNRRSVWGGWYGARFTSGGSNRASARFFISRSASTYMCVVVGLS